MIMDKGKLFKSLRSRNVGLFGTSLTQGQVDGVEAIVDECIRQGVDLGQAAYMLATGYGETGGKMQAVRENLNYSASAIRKHFGAHRRQGLTPEQLARKPELLANTVYGGDWGKRNLGNIKKTDGWDFRGWGLGQWTGRRNTRKAGEDVGLDLISNPAQIDDVRINARLLVLWMMNGTATGERLSSYVSGDKKDYRGARVVWGGVDAEKYVAHAKNFERALAAAGYAPNPDAPAYPDPQEQPSGIAAIIAAILALYDRMKK